MLKALKIFILVLFIGGTIFVFGLLAHRSFSEGGPFQIPQGSAQETKPLMVEKKISLKKVDKDKNKIFDDLEEVLVGQPDETVFDTILLFEENLSDNLFERAKSSIGNFSIKYQYSSISGIAATLTKGQIIALSKIPFVKQIEEDAVVVPFLDKATYWFGVQKARTDFGLDGNMDGSPSYSKDDIVIAVIDTGIDPNHVDLDGGKIIGWKDIALGQLNPYDELGACGGHGTHVSSIIAGEGQGNSLYKGVAPGAALVGVKVLKKQGNNCVGSSSNVIAGVQWVIDNKATYGIKVFNMSIGTSGCSNGTDSTSLIVNNAVDAGLVGVVAAGNEGPAKCTIGSPAAAAKAITVGAMADVDPGVATAGLPAKGFYQAYFSSRGPTADGRIKPDISAPGVKITAAKAGTANGYIEYDGTSMASPFVAGLAGLMLQAKTTLTPAEIKSKIATTAVDWDASGGGTGGLTVGSDIDYGAGRLDGYEAIKSAGGFSGTSIAVPNHQYQADSLSSANTQDWWNIDVKNTSYPIAVTMIMPNWAGSTNPDFDMELYAPDGTTKLAESISATRQETIGYQPTAAGIYKLRVYRYAGAGNYFFDLSAGLSPAVSITLTTDGTTPFGIVALGTTKDTTALGTNDVQTVQVITGPANLDVKSTIFSDGTSSWSLGSTNGINQVKWEFSTSTSGVWTAFLSPNTLYDLANNVSQSGTQDLYLRLTMPTETSSLAQYGSTITIVATAP